MQVDEQTGLISCSTYIPSPNCDNRPVNVCIDLLVIHGISLPPGKFGGRSVQALFCNQLDPHEHPYFQTLWELRVSSHLYIDREGQVWQFVPFHQRAWHAGASCFEGKEHCNDFSIGIELEGTDDIPYTALQYTALAQATRALITAYSGITLNRIVGHSDVAPERKTDPGIIFDWITYKQMI